MPKPPPHAVMHKVGNEVYYVGTLYLRAHEDTVGLKRLGFCGFEYAGRSFGSLKYKAEWTRAMTELPLPDFVNGMDYDSTLPENSLVFDYFEDSDAGGSSAYPAFGKHAPEFNRDTPLFQVNSIGGCHYSRG